MDGLLFGTAGIPLSSPSRNSLSGIVQVSELRLDAMELEFVRGVRMSEETALRTGKLASGKNIVLTAHAPYFINLASTDGKKAEASIKRIVDTARITYAAGGWSVVFHAGFFQKREKKAVYHAIRRALESVTGTLDDEGIDLWIRPETTGKPSQFSGLDDLIELSSGFDRMLPCVDFAHLHARSAGKCNTYEEFCSVFDRISDALGKQALKEMHMHVSGIDYTEKGERRHLALQDSDMNWKSLLDCMKDRRIAGVLISESPLIEQDALRMKYYYHNKHI